MKSLTRNLASALVALALPLSAALAMVACSGDDDEPAPIAVAALTLQPKTLDLLVGESGNLTATMTPDNASNKAVKWTSSDTNVAESPTGTGLTASLTARNAGDTIITVTSEADPNKTDTCIVTVRAPIPVASVTLDKTTLTLRLEEPVGTLAATVLPATATNKELDWTSSDPTIAGVVAAGTTATVTHLAPGTTTITVASKADPNKSSACLVTVLPVKPPTPDVYIAGHFGVYVNGVKDTRFPAYDANYPHITGISDIFVDAAGNVHACGDYIDYGLNLLEAVYYKNGVREVLQMNHGANDLESHAYGMTVDGTDVYIAGGEWFYDSYGNEKLAPRLWKNGVIQPLESNENDGWENHCWANAVHVYNGIVYVAGETDEDDSWPRPVVWRNGVEHIFHDLDDYEIYDFGIETSGTYAGNLFALCYNYYGGNYGDPGRWTVWRISADTNTMTKLWALDNAAVGVTMYVEVVHIGVDGDKWVVGGYIDDDAFYYTSAGELKYLPSPAGTAYAEATDMFIKDGDVYIAGTAGINDYPSTQGFKLALWINGQLLTGEGAITDTLPGNSSGTLYEAARARGLHVQ